MIRINLLSHKREAKKGGESDTRWLLFVGGAVLLEIILLLFFHQAQREQLSREKRKSAELASEIEQVKKAIANQAEVKAQLDVLRAREEAINKLQAARSGPAAILLELAQMLTPGRGPTADPDHLQQLRRDNPASVYNPAWDPRRLWLTSLQEADRTLKLEGLARDGDDVSELARRLGLSVQFSDVKLLPGSRTTESQSGVELIRFQLQVKARY